MALRRKTRRTATGATITGQTWYLRYRVPAELVQLEGRRFGEETTGETCRSLAERYQRIRMGQLEQRWQALRAKLSPSSSPVRRIQALGVLAVERARRGSPEAASEVLAMELEDMLGQHEPGEASNLSPAEVEAIADVQEKLQRADQLDLSTARDDYLQELRDRGTTDTHVQANRAIIKQLEETLGQTPVALVTRRNAVAHIDRLKAAGKMPSTVRRHVSSLGSLWSWLQGREEVSANVWSGLGRTVRGNQSRGRRAWTEEELKAVLQVTEDDQDLHDALMTFSYTGLRLSELLDMQAEHISKEDNGRLVLHVHGTKTAAAKRPVPVHAAVQEIIERRLSAADDGAVFALGSRRVVSRKIISRIRKAGITDSGVVVHSLRNLFATRLEAAGVPMHTGASLMGHQRPGLTYGGYSGGPSLAVLFEAIDAMP